jgi:hypothetical protein
MLEQYVRRDWVGEDKDTLLALPDWIPADVRAHPRSYLVPQPTTESENESDGGSDGGSDVEYIEWEDPTGKGVHMTKFDTDPDF